MTITNNFNALCNYSVNTFNYTVENFNDLPPLKKGIVLVISALTTVIALPIIGRFGVLVVGVVTFTTLNNYLSKLDRESKRQTNRKVFALFNSEIELFKSRFSSVDLKNNYWWFIEGSTKSPNNSHEYRKNYISSSEDNYLDVVKDYENYALKNLGTLNPDNFDFTLKFALVEKNAEDDFNLYSYYREILSRDGVEETPKDWINCESLSKHAVDSFCKEKIQANCPFDKIQ